MKTLTDITASNLNKAWIELETLPVILGSMAKNHFLKGFEQGGGQTNKSLGGWKARKTKNKSDRRTKRNRAILVDSGDLRRSIKSVVENGGAKIITDSTAYAERHNEGLAGMPQREFIGESDELKNKLEARIKETIDSIFK